MEKHSKTFNKSLIGIVIGAIIGLINAVPMITTKVPTELGVATFLNWTIIGYVFSICKLNLNNTLKGFIISLLLFIPLMCFILNSSPLYALWILIMCLIWGSLLGYLFQRVSKDA
ncbi:MAG: hypothetical protein ACRC7R_08485 [Sarcina sp.]